MADLGEIPEIPVEIEEKKPSKGRSILVTIITIFIGIVAGGAALYFVGPKLGIVRIPGAEEPPGTVVLGETQAQQRIADLERRLNEYTVLGRAQEIKDWRAELDQRRQAQGTIEQVQRKVTDMEVKEAEYDALTRDLETLNERIASGQESYENTSRQNAEAESRLTGLRTEIARLEGQVGELEVADARRRAVKTTLVRDVEQLVIQIRKSIPLAPPEYRKEVRLEKVLKLKNELDNSKWVRPELLEEYTQLYLEELQIATQEKYFIAKIPLVEKKKEVKKWAECVSIGSQLAYFETLDRTFTGVCRNTNPEGPVPRYEFIVELPRTELMEIRDIMAQYRPEDYEQRIRAQLGEEVELVGKRPTAAQQRRAS